MQVMLSCMVWAMHALVKFNLHRTGYLYTCVPLFITSIYYTVNNVNTNYSMYVYSQVSIYKLHCIGGLVASGNQSALGVQQPLSQKHFPFSHLQADPSHPWQTHGQHPPFPWQLSPQAQDGPH